MNGSLNNGYDQIAACNEWVRKITQEGITRDEVLDTYRKWTTLSDYESVFHTFILIYFRF